MRRRLESNRLRRGIAILSLGVSAAVLASTASAATFSNTTPIVIDQLNTGPGSEGDPSPSTISVSGIISPVVVTRVSLNNISRTADVTDIDAILRGPGGQTVVLMSASCGSQPIAGVTLAFEDTAAASLPANAACANGTFKPTDNGPTETDATWTGVPAANKPTITGHTTLSALTGTPNGNWDLFTRNGGGDFGTGSIAGGWTLNLETAASAVGGAPGGAPGGSTPCAGSTATLVGTQGNDVITGTPGPDVIAALGGNDKVNSGKGKDIVCGGAGKDKLGGGAGKDKLLGEAGKDVLKGARGKDKLLGAAGKDVLKGAGGKDRLLGGAGRDTLIGGTAKDVCKGGKGHDKAAASCEAQNGI